MDDDFERRRELRRQKREEMRIEAERAAYGSFNDDEEEAARERRRRARQERLRNKESEEQTNPPESVELSNSHSVTVTESVSSSVIHSAGGGEDEEQALVERLAKREERRQRRMKDALDRQRELDASPVAMENVSADKSLEDRASNRRGRYHEQEDEPQPINSKAEVTEEGQGDDEEEAEKLEVVDVKPRRSFREQVTADDEDGTRKREVVSLVKQQNGSVHDDSPPKHKKPERTLSRGSMRSPEAVEQVEDEDARLEAERKLEELKRRRDETESEEFQRMRQKQLEAEAELEELKRKREERKKVLEEEERHRKQEEEQRKAREEEEKRRMKEEIERRRAEAAERRQKVEDSVDGEPRKPFKCVSPRGSSLKIGERAEFLNKSAQKSSAKASQTPVVSKIDNRLEQYTSAVQSNKEVRSPRSAAIDMPVVTDGIRNIKTMWERGNVFGSSGGPATANKDAAGMKIGVAGRINDWLNKTPEAVRTPGGRPADLKPGDVTGKRNLWENKGSSPEKVAGRGESKSVANAGMRH
ncbi:caldesmon 1a isoform X2 [Denticeps clupeoides]|uniref:caldesmon 1a isoform X2 n=1 Tax=Denticeps clupeoides TaxID=299321 RepID=UPI0010A4AA0A|nr:non-muscle caldesmon-like isoform X2 [Denticeps clupeoides]